MGVIGFTPKSCVSNLTAVTLFVGSNLNQATLTTETSAPAQRLGLIRRTCARCQGSEVTLAGSSRLRWRPVLDDAQADAWRGPRQSMPQPPRAFQIHRPAPSARYSAEAL